MLVVELLEEVEASDVVEDVGLDVFLGLFHRLSAPPCRNQGGKGLLVVVNEMRGAQAK